MPRVNHIDIVEIGSRRFICHINRVIERNIPNRESLKLCVARFDTSLVFMIKLGKTSRHFAASGAGRGNNHQLFGGFNVIILAVSLVADNFCNVGGIALNRVVVIDIVAERMQLLFKRQHARLRRVLGKHHTADQQALVGKFINQTNDIKIVGNAEVGTQFCLFNILRTDDNHNFRFLFELQEHLQLTVRLETRQYPGSMEIIKKFTAEFQIELAAKLGNALPDALGLHGQILIIIKPDFVHFSSPQSNKSYKKEKRLYIYLYSRPVLIYYRAILSINQ